MMLRPVQTWKTFGCPGVWGAASQVKHDNGSFGEHVHRTSATRNYKQHIKSFLAHVYCIYKVCSDEYNRHSASPKIVKSVQ